MPKNSTALRITVTSDKADEARKLFSTAGFSGMKEEPSSRGGNRLVAFVWGDINDADKWRAMNAIPQEMYAFQGIVGGQHD